MIKTVLSIDDLFSNISLDKQDNTPFSVRYPLRLIFCNNMDSFRLIIKRLSALDVTLFHLNSLLPHEDGWLTPDDIVTAVKSQTNDAVIVPLSELIRFFSDAGFYSLMTTLFEIENSITSTLRRIYVPILGLKERFETVFFSRFHRKDKGSPVWYVEDDILKKKFTICYQGFEAELPCNFKIANTNQWLDIWKQNNLTHIICTSKTMGYLYEKFLPDGIFEIKKIHTYQEYLKSIRGITIPIEYKKEEDIFWKTLTEHMGKYDDCKSYIHQHFNIYNFSTISKDEILKIWLQKKDKYSKWLLSRWVISQELFINSYLFHVLSVVKAFSDEELIEYIWLSIFDHVYREMNLCDERKAYLNCIHNELHYPCEPFEQKIQHRIHTISEQPFHVQVDYLTNITFFEKKHIIESFKKTPELERHVYKAFIQRIYPELFYYMEWDIPLDNKTLDARIITYFQEYTLSKALDCKSSEIDRLINELNNDAETFYKWYYEIDDISQYYAKSLMIWIDGLGAEWFPLLEYLITVYGKEKNRCVEKKFITKSNLPTITECNRFNNAVHVLEFDKYIHQKTHYMYPDDLIGQIELLKKIIKKEIIDRTDDNLCIVSDHGVSFLAQKRFGNVKKFDFTNANHEGRCMWTDKAYQNDSEFILHEIDSGYCKGKKALIALKHTSLHDTPCREVHGGATPEEVLVPFLVISKRDKKICYHVELLTPKVTTKNPKIAIKIDPHPTSSIEFRLKGEHKLFLIKREGNQWASDVTGLKTGTYVFDLIIQNQHYELEVTIQGGIKETELF
ncbi:MAG: BREX-4 system phosphatase PglZ [Desulfobacterales bacterium]|nr:BREX-4 system phosphatase PglZ [Desulfobacterales bacterium]